VAPDVADRIDGELFLIDGNSLAYRAFFALPESIATADGRPTNAIYGFASMMAKLLIDHRPAQVIVAWDAGMSGRETEYPEYKAGRPSRPDLLREQWPHLMPLAEAFGFRNVKVQGWEADDVIATLARPSQPWTLTFRKPNASASGIRCGHCSRAAPRRTAGP
jgi:DNA polymerase I